MESPNDLLQMFIDKRCGKHFKVKGYWFVRIPRWYTGRDNNGFVALHTIICCAANGITEIPPDHEVHHRNMDKLDNRPENLQLLTHKAHAQVHAQLRKEKRNERPHKG